MVPDLADEAGRQGHQFAVDEDAGMAFQRHGLRLILHCIAACGLDVHLAVLLLHHGVIGLFILFILLVVVGGGAVGGEQAAGPWAGLLSLGVLRLLDAGDEGGQAGTP